MKTSRVKTEKPRKIKRIPLGKENGEWKRSKRNENCQECGTRPGDLHRMHCSEEECPICKGQLSTCSPHHIRKVWYED